MKKAKISLNIKDDKKQKWKIELIKKAKKVKKC